MYIDLNEIKTYEGHITIEPVFDEELERVKLKAKAHKFRVADLMMLKRPEETPEQSMYGTFMTGHSTSLMDIKTRIEDLILALRLDGTVVYRYKIEEIICDSKYRDTLGLLK